MKHILELDWFTDSKSTTQYLDNVIYKIKTLLSSPESAMLLRDLYDDEYNLKYYDKATEIVFSSVLYRESEKVYNYLSLQHILDQYSDLDIQKFYGISIKEYLELTRYERTVLNEQALGLINKLNRKMQEIKDSTNFKNGNINYSDFDF